MIHVSAYLHHLSVEPGGSVFSKLWASSCIAIRPLQHTKDKFTQKKAWGFRHCYYLLLPKPQNKDSILAADSEYKA